MKLTKNLFATLTISSALFVSSLAAAQEKKDEKLAVPPTRPAGLPDRTAALAKYLGLSDEQNAKIKPILDEEMSQTRALREATSTKVTPLLTPEQLQKWQKMRPRPAAPGSPANPAVRPPTAPGAAPDPAK